MHKSAESISNAFVNANFDSFVNWSESSKKELRKRRKEEKPQKFRETSSSEEQLLERMDVQTSTSSRVPNSAAASSSSSSSSATAAAGTNQTPPVGTTAAPNLMPQRKLSCRQTAGWRLKLTGISKIIQAQLIKYNVERMHLVQFLENLYSIQNHLPNSEENKFYLKHMAEKQRINMLKFRGEHSIIHLVTKSAEILKMKASTLHEIYNEFQRSGKFIPDGRGHYDRMNILERYMLVFDFKRFLNQSKDFNVDTVHAFVNGKGCLGLFEAKYGDKNTDEAMEAMGQLPISRTSVYAMMLSVGEAKYDTVKKVKK